MTSFTKQFRAGIGAIARESLDESLALPAEEVDATLAEPVAAEIEQEVVAPGAEIVDGADALMEAEGDATTLDNTAVILADSAEGEGEGVDAPGAEMATLTLERIVNKYSLARGAAFSKESFAPAGRKQATLSLAREAEDASKSLKERISAAFKRFLAFITDLIKSIFDKRTKLLKRAAALQTKIEAIKDKTSLVGKKISIKNAGNKLGTDVLKAVNALPDFIKGLEKVKAISADNSYSDEDKNFKPFDFNPNALGGFTLNGKVEDGKYVIEREATEASGESVEIEAFNNAACIKIIAGVRTAMAALEAGEADLKTAIANMNGGASKVMSVITGKEGGESVARMKILSRLSAMSTLSSAIAGATLTTVAYALNAVEKSTTVTQENLVNFVREEPKK